PRFELRLELAPRDGQHFRERDQAALEPGRRLFRKQVLRSNAADPPSQDRSMHGRGCPPGGQLGSGRVQKIQALSHPVTATRLATLFQEIGVFRTLRETAARS